MTPTTTKAGKATGVVTNGIEQRTTAHLNLTKSLADVKRRYERQNDAKIPYAGKGTA